MKLEAKPGARLAYSIEEASQMTSLSMRKMAYLIRDGVLKSRKVGRRRLILAESLEKFIKDGQAA